MITINVALRFKNTPLQFNVWFDDLKPDFLQLLPWGGKISSESLRFFSPIVLWTRFASSQDNFNILFSAFRDYYQVNKSILADFCLCFLWYVWSCFAIGLLKCRFCPWEKGHENEEWPSELQNGVPDCEMYLHLISFFIFLGIVSLW